MNTAETITPGSYDNELWNFHCYIAGITCGHHEEDCYGPRGHWALQDEAERAGFYPAHDLTGSWENLAYRNWLLAALHWQRGPGWRRHYSGFDFDLPASASPIERSFWEACALICPNELAGLVFQYSVGRYRIDFALPERKIGIELDGFATHSSTADIARDRKRQRDLERAGWHIIRFGGSEVHHDAESCVRQAANLISSRRGEGS